MPITTSQIVQDKQQVRDELGYQTESVPIFKIGSETIDVFHGPVRLTTRNIGNAFILDSTTNGILDTANGLSNGQITLDEGDIGPTTELRIVNYKNIFNDLLRSTYYVDTGVTTATVNTTNHDITFTNGQIFQTNVIYYEDVLIDSATLILDENNITGIANLSFYLSADDGKNWELVTNSVLHYFTKKGTKLKFKIVASGNAIIDVEDTNGRTTPIFISYSSGNSLYYIGLNSKYDFADLKDDAGQGCDLVNSGLTSGQNDRFGNANGAYEIAKPNYAESKMNHQISGSTARSISIWFKISSNLGNEEMVSWGVNAGVTYCSLELESSVSGVVCFNNGTTKIHAGAGLGWGYNEWHNIIVTFDGTSTAKIYADGVLTDSSSSFSMNTTASKIRVGYRTITSADPTYIIDDIRIYSRELTLTEVTNLYNDTNLYDI